MKKKENVQTVMSSTPLNVVHISPYGRDMWAVRLDSSLRARRILKSQPQALEFVKPLQKKGYEVAVHRKDGLIDFMLAANGERF